MFFQFFNLTFTALIVQHSVAVSQPYILCLKVGICSDYHEPAVKSYVSKFYVSTMQFRSFAFSAVIVTVTATPTPPTGGFGSIPNFGKNDG
jgi:hypothetical protein